MLGIVCDLPGDSSVDFITVEVQFSELNWTGRVTDVRDHLSNEYRESKTQLDGCTRFAPSIQFNSILSMEVYVCKPQLPVANTRAIQKRIQSSNSNKYVSDLRCAILQLSGGGVRRVRIHLGTIE